MNDFKSCPSKLFMKNTKCSLDELIYFWVRLMSHLCWSHKYRNILVIWDLGIIFLPCFFFFYRCEEEVAQAGNIIFCCGLSLKNFICYIEMILSVYFWILLSVWSVSWLSLNHFWGSKEAILRKKVICWSLILWHCDSF